eukprot:TRINITY_DN1342_c0_g1_i2.p1 TRINITY_DN1342_c0_g1~~TRINITY_DN1342_c0_g1_i2.p1  ORF type:complete len:495 (+),score=105.54 TRINITY_DN1342_c0_g1_i2:109-1485(+)
MKRPAQSSGNNSWKEEEEVASIIASAAPAPTSAEPPRKKVARSPSPNVNADAARVSAGSKSALNISRSPSPFRKALNSSSSGEVKNEEKAEGEEEEHESAGEGEVEDAEKDKDPATLVENFRVSPENVEMLRKRNITHFFPIQAATYEQVLAGRDIVGRAKTGSGKTLSFALPTVERLFNAGAIKWPREDHGTSPLVLCLAPTRELAKQNAEEFEYCGRGLLRGAVVYGGVPIQSQCFQLRRGVDVIVGTPGRIIDCMARGVLKLDKIQVVILDEADEMLSLGFQEPVEKILSGIPKEPSHQTLLFSATLPGWVKSLTSKYLQHDFNTVDLVKESAYAVPEQVRHMCVCCPRESKATVLGDLIKMYGKDGRTIVFCDFKNEASELAVSPALNSDSQAIHGDIAQAQREITLQGFKKVVSHLVFASWPDFTSTRALSTSSSVYFLQHAASTRWIVANEF